MSRENETGAEFERGAGGQALDQGLQHAAKPSADAKIRREADINQAKTCTTCGDEFVPRRRHYRKCKPCAELFKQELVEHARKRTADGVTVFQLLEHLHALRSDDESARQWLAALIEQRRTE